MKAGLVTGLRRLDLVDVPEPQAAPGTAVVEVSRCGICGTDVHGFLSSEPYNPAICGHEWTGTVSAAGDGVRHLAEGDRVVAGISPACGTCAACRAGQEAWCVTAFLGMVGRDPLAPPHGGFAPRIAVDARRLVKVTEPLTDEQAAMVEPATVALHALRRAPLQLGDVAVVLGAGPIGLLTLQCAKAAGAGRLVVSEPDERRRDLAAALGADVVVAPEALPDAVAEATRGLGADVVLECVGRGPAIQAAVDQARRGGRVTLVGFAAESATISPATWLVKEVTVVTSLGYRHEEFGQVMALIADGRLRVDELHTGTVGLDGLADAVAELADHPSRHVKVLVDPSR